MDLDLSSEDQGGIMTATDNASRFVWYVQTNKCFGPEAQTLDLDQT